MPAAAAARSQPGLQGHRLVMRDNIHLFDPGAEHHEVLATEGSAATSPGKPPLSTDAQQELLLETNLHLLQLHPSLLQIMQQASLLGGLRVEMLEEMSSQSYALTPCLMMLGACRRAGH